MHSLQWYEILTKAILQIKNENIIPEIKRMLLVLLDDNIRYFSVDHEKEHENASVLLLGQAWNSLTHILQNEIQLEEWDNIKISGLHTTLTCFSLTIDPRYPLLLVILHDSSYHPTELLKTLLKSVFQIGYQQKYETVGLISNEGYPIWVTFPEGKEMDDFLFAISITSLLSLVERIDMEVAAGGVSSCLIQGNEKLLLNVTFNPSQNLTLAITQQGTELTDSMLDSELSNVYEKIVEPIFPIDVPEITDKDRKQILQEIRQEFEGETTEEEIQTLTAFNGDTLNSLEREIKSLSKKYGASEISVGYLRRRLKLPREVLSMALEYLISNQSIRGKIGTDRKSGGKVLVLEFLSEMSAIEIERIENVKSQVNDLFLPLEPLLKKIPKVERRIKKEDITKALSEFQIILTLSDTDSLFMLAYDIRTFALQIDNSNENLTLLNDQLLEVSFDDILRKELVNRIEIFENKIHEQFLTLVGKLKKLETDLLNSYRLLTQILPAPYEFRSSEIQGKGLISFRCPVHNCEKEVVIEADPRIWIKIALFGTKLGIYDEFPNASEDVIKIKSEYEEKYQKLTSKMQYENYSNFKQQKEYVENINDLLISNNSRDKALGDLRSLSTEGEEGFYSTFGQCNSCLKWFCQRHKSTNTKCIYCR